MLAPVLRQPLQQASREQAEVLGEVLLAKGEKWIGNERGGS